MVVRDRSASCSVAQLRTTLISPTAINATFNFTVPSCNSCADGILVANVTGGTPPYTYRWGNSFITGIAQDYQFGIFRRFNSFFPPLLYIILTKYGRN